MKGVLRFRENKLHKCVRFHPLYIFHDNFLGLDYRELHPSD